MNSIPDENAEIADAVGEQHPEDASALTSPAHRGAGRREDDRRASEAVAHGIFHSDMQGELWLDAMAGRTSPRGYGGQRAAKAAQRAVAEAFASPRQPLDEAFNQGPASTSGPGAAQLAEWLADGGVRRAERVALTSSREAAVEGVVMAARRLRSPDRTRTVALLGSDHGRSMLCRTLSGRPELHEQLGPMTAGFSHFAAGDHDAMRRAVDEQTIAVVVSPLAVHDAARPLDADVLQKLRSRCDEVGAILIADESLACFGCCGAPSATVALSGIELDVVVHSAGLFGGWLGAALVGPAELVDVAEPDAPTHALLDALLSATLAELGDRATLAGWIDRHREFATALAQRLTGFEFIRDVHATGATLGIELDVPAVELVQAAAAERLRLEIAGEYAVWMQLPLLLEPSEHQELLARLGASLEAVERQAALAGG